MLPHSHLITSITSSSHKQQLLSSPLSLVSPIECCGEWFWRMANTGNEEIIVNCHHHKKCTNENHDKRRVIFMFRFFASFFCRATAPPLWQQMCTTMMLWEHLWLSCEGEFNLLSYATFRSLCSFHSLPHQEIMTSIEMLCCASFTLRCMHTWFNLHRRSSTKKHWNWFDFKPRNFISICFLHLSITRRWVAILQCNL